MKYLAILFVGIIELVMATVFTLVYLIWNFKFNKMYFRDAYEDIKETFKDIKGDG
jgi:hypothetical protein